MIDQISAQNELYDSMIIERMQMIKQMLSQGKDNANRWWYGWLKGYSAATFAQGTVALVSWDLETRQDMILGAATNFLGAVGQLVTPRIPGYASQKLKTIPGITYEERIQELIEAEKLLKESTLREESGRS